MQEAQTASSTLPKLATVKNLPSCFPLLGLTTAAVHGQIFKSKDRFDSKGRLIPGNGLAETGAIIRRGRKVLIDVDKYAAWLSNGGL
ncbi:hypothetical protein [Nitrosomonas ureae]|uniref:Uncharacterized protein n=1 Tax=Nitrosomonas ureae TaxID=44577 RepID=A0A1H2ERD0_9PROT|nr:hypothetical protein [Nitrosomonas ureae]ALQ51859.1 hypothetical protein ATY38_11920 [Nitrosomonas ureae]SDT97503.1 hypothetical protein SAMN05216406_11488 [Nitrosomonas ureae]